MPRLLSLSRAARLVGMTRGSLQKHISSGELTSFEGQVSLDELQKLYPQLELESRAMLDRVEEIIERAKYKARSRKSLPTDKQSLLSRAALLGDELAIAKLDLSNFAIFSQKLKSRVNVLIEHANNKDKTDLIQLLDWIDAELPKVGEQVSHQHQLYVQDTMLRLITAHVTIQPSGHDFFLEGNTSLLEAGLSSGYALNYGCSNGNCGKCKAKLIEGEITKIRQYDYSLTEAEKSQGYFLMCCHSAVTDITISAEEAGTTEEIPHQTVTTKVKKIEHTDSGITILNLKTPRTKRLRFLAGQRATIFISDSISTELSIASCPCDDMNLQFHLDNSISAPFYDYVVNKLGMGDEIRLEGPDGHFVLDDNAENPLIFIVLDTGFAPVKSLIEHAITLSHAEHIHLYRFISSGHQPYLSNLCRAWSDAFESLDYKEIFLEPSLKEEAGKRKLLQEIENLNNSHSNFDNHHVYIAGSEDFLQLCKQSLPTDTIPILMTEAV